MRGVKRTHHLFSELLPEFLAVVTVFTDVVEDLSALQDHAVLHAKPVDTFCSSVWVFNVVQINGDADGQG